MRMMAETEVAAGLDEVGEQLALPLVERVVDLSECVERGAALASVDSSEYGRARGAYITAAARVEQAQATYQRQELLRQDRISSAADFEAARANLAATRADLEAARGALVALGLGAPGATDSAGSTVTLRSPIAGIVVARWQVQLVGVAIGSARGNPQAPRIRIPSHFYPPWQLRGSLIEQLARGRDTIGIVPLPWYAEPVVGVLSQPVGERQIHFVPENLEEDFAPWYERVRPRYVVMENCDEIPEPMARLQPQVHKASGLTVLQFW